MRVRVLERRSAVLVLLVCVVLWSTSGLFVKISTLNPIALAGGRSLIAALTVWAWIGRPRFSWSRYQIGGALCMSATFLLFLSATRMTAAANAILLQYTAPVYVALFGAWFLGERPRAYDWWTMGVIVGGMALFLGDKLTAQGMLGNLFAVLSGVTMAWMTLLLRKLRDGQAGETLLLGNLITAAVGLPFLAVAVARGAVQPVEWGILLYMGVLQLGVPFILYAIALRSLSALEAVLLSTLEPILNPIWVFLVVGERPGPWALAGGAVVLVAVTARSLIASGALRRAPVKTATT